MHSTHPSTTREFARCVISTGFAERLGEYGYCIGRDAVDCQIGDKPGSRQVTAPGLFPHNPECADRSFVVAGRAREGTSNKIRGRLSAAPR